MGQWVISCLIGSIEQRDNISWRHIGLDVVASRKNVPATWGQCGNLTPHFLRYVFGPPIRQDRGISNVGVEREAIAILALDAGCITISIRGWL
jgi:hypothetical protein